MNEQTSKKILFNKSTLFSLKAELLKKQEEVHNKKQLPQHKLENFKPAVKPQDSEQASNKPHKKTLKDNLKAVDTEELEACRKAKLALEKKAELYEHLSDGAGNSELAGRFLVDFNTKKQQEPTIVPQEKPIAEPDNVDLQNDDNEWTEFTDCLGRTRKCHKSDLDMYLDRDKALMRVMYKDKLDDDQSVVQESNKQTEKPLLVQKTQDYLQSLRDKWEQKERELLSKDKDIHYQDLLFDEARIHGVGYYSFSTEESERRRQMQELMRTREETMRKQREAEEVRAKRDALMAARVAAARARQRARAGLPPEEEPQENQDDFTKRLLEFLTKQKDEADAKANEEARIMKEEQERERQKLREAYVREWDIGKEGVDGGSKGFREMTQEEYVEQQRSKRLDEFAPPQTSTSKQTNYTFDTRGKALGPIQNKSWDEVRPKAPTPPPPEIGDVSHFDEQKGLYFTSSTKIDKVLKYKNFVKQQEPVPIENELDQSDDLREAEKRRYDSNAEVAPPPTYDYYGPVPKQMKTQKPFESDIREAYAQGAKSLETKSTCKQLSSRYDFTFD